VVAFGGNTDCPAVAPVADPTAIFDSTNGTWSAGPGIPAICGSDGATSCTLADAPAALQPNGNVLFAASTGYVSSIETYSNSPTHFFEFTSANVVNQVADTIFYADSNPSYVYNFLVLPNGQILSTDSSNTPEVYTPTGGADPGWTPLISTAPSVVAAGATYPIGGTQFNGLSQGAYYGDGVQSWTNYPIVQITNSDTGHIFYARTFGHSTMSIEPGNEFYGAGSHRNGRQQPGGHRQRHRIASGFRHGCHEHDTDIHAVADRIGIWHSAGWHEQYGAGRDSVEHRHGGSPHQEHHAYRQERRAVRPDQRLPTLGCGRSDLHDQRGVRTERDGIKDGDAERECGRRCRDTDGHHHRNGSCGTLHGIADLVILR
jgi:hypothetical protein